MSIIAQLIQLLRIQVFPLDGLSNVNNSRIFFAFTPLLIEIYDFAILYAKHFLPEAYIKWYYLLVTLILNGPYNHKIYVCLKRSGHNGVLRVGGGGARGPCPPPRP